MIIETVLVGSLPATRLTASDGSQVTITHFGAHIVSWITAEGRERLFLSEKSALDGTKAIRGGIPIIFPQFAEYGAGMRHGFARLSTWRLAESGADKGMARADFVLEPEDLALSHRAAWPHRFELRLSISVGEGALAIELVVANKGSEAFGFSAALHSYWRVDTLGQTRLRGVTTSNISFDDKIDSIFEESSGLFELCDGKARLSLKQMGFDKVVVWNPGAADAAALPDLGYDEFKTFLCVEPLALCRPQLLPGETWQGGHLISIANSQGNLCLHRDNNRSCD